MTKISQLLDRANQAGNFTLAEIRDYVSPHVADKRALELMKRVHNSVQDLNETERICALLCALMVELI
jgi:hypothetical protein